MELLDVGTRVIGASYRSIGEVLDVASDRFLLRHHEAGNELWLPHDIVFTANGGVAQLICDPEGVWRYAIPRGSSDSLDDS